MGYGYEKGQGIPQNYAKAVEWYRKAAEQGHILAQNNLGNMYNDGQGVSQDYEQALVWYRKSAEQGYAVAQAVLGYMYGTGQGVPKDHAQSVDWYRKAAAQGNATAQDNLRIVEKELNNEQLESAVQKQIDDMEAQGYKHMSFTDFELDAKSMPLGTKLAITGLYQATGQMEKLTENILPNSLSIILITDNASRPTRKRFIECRGIGSFCTLTLLGHTNKCDVKWLGSYVSTSVCLVVEKRWEYENKP